MAKLESYMYGYQKSIYFDNGEYHVAIEEGDKKPTSDDHAANGNSDFNAKREEMLVFLAKLRPPQVHESYAR